jgi:hypothetical protein
MKWVNEFYMNKWMTLRVVAVASSAVYFSLNVDIIIRFEFSQYLKKVFLHLNIQSVFCKQQHYSLLMIQMSPNVLFHIFKAYWSHLSFKSIIISDWQHFLANVKKKIESCISTKSVEPETN